MYFEKSINITIYIKENTSIWFTHYDKYKLNTKKSYELNISTLKYNKYTNNS